MAGWVFNREVSLRDLQGEFDRLVDRLWHGGINTAPLDGQDWAPPVEVIDESDRFVIAAEVPGLAPEDVDVAVAERVVTLSGQKNAPRSGAESKSTLRSERRYGKFKRVIELPESVDETRVQASCAHGVLTITLPKQVVAQGRRVPVQSTE